MTEQTETKPQKKKNLLKSGMIVSASTLLSRILGLVRDVIIANLLGASLAADVFFFANRISFQPGIRTGSGRIQRQRSPHLP